MTLDAIQRELLQVKEQFPSILPRLDIIKANNRVDSEIYVRRKMITLQKLGFQTRLHELAHPEQAHLENLIRRLNEDNECFGILLQSPLECTIDKTPIQSKLAALIAPHKDVDGLSPTNLGQLATSKGALPLFIPCTPMGIMAMLSHYRIKVQGRNVAIVGRSEVVGMPSALLFSRADATVMICHSKSRNLADLIRRADIVVVAIGRPQHIRGEWIREGAVVIDVGINRQLAADGTVNLVGDVDFQSASRVASAITPVPGGVGPMTVAMLARNMMVTARLRVAELDSSKRDEAAFQAVQSIPAI